MFSIRWRLTIYFALVILTIVALLVGILLMTAIRGVKASVEETTRSSALTTVRLLEAGTLPSELGLTELAEENVFIVVRDGEGQIIARTGSPASGLTAVDPDEREDVWRTVLETEDAVVEQHTPELLVHALPVASDISTARVVEAWKSYDETANAIIPWLSTVTIGIPTCVILVVVGAYLITRSALSPVNAIVRAANEISERDLSQRLPVKHKRDELGRLAMTFNELLSRLEAAFNDREETLRRQQQFVADASHELRTPLTSIQGYTRMLREWALENPDIARESVAAVDREATRMGELVDSLLSLARGDEALALDLQPHDLREIVLMAVDSMKVATSRQLEIVYHPPSAPVGAMLDRDQVRRVIDILLDNAQKYTPDGGTVAVSIRRTGREVAVDVTDTGIGIPSENLPHIFERFYRVDASRSTSGTGLGLSIARQIVNAHGGTLSVASAPGKGSIFTLSIPAFGDRAIDEAPNADDDDSR